MAKRSSRPRTPAAPSPATDLFRIAFHNSPAMQTLTRTTDRVLVEVNETFLKTLGYAREEVIGRTALELQFWIHPEKAEPFRARLAESGSVRGFEVEIRSKAGDVRTVLLSADRVDIDGVAHVVAAGVDITERKAAEARLRDSDTRLRESEARFGTAFRASPGMMTIARLSDGGYVEVNDAFLHWLGREREQVLGHSWQEFALWENPAGGERFFAELQRKQSVRNVECPLRRPDGVRSVLLVSADIIAINQEPHILGFAVDISEQRRAEVELQHALAKERELNQLKSDFVSLVSHEFRTPLEVIMSSADNLERYHDRLPPEKRSHLLRTIHKSVARMSGMMEEVLLLGRLDTERTEFHPAPLDLAAFCRRVADEMETATAHRCPIQLDCIPTLEGAVGDEAALRHILSNLLSNAVKYSEAGRPVTFAIAREGPDALFRITDQGCGIPVADQPRLFQAFSRGSNVRQIPGTGLGLLIVRRCVDLHRGAITFESAEGKGTTLLVRLPLFAVQP